MEQDTGKRKTSPWVWLIAVVAVIIIIILISMVGDTKDDEREIPDVSSASIEQVQFKRAV